MNRLLTMFQSRNRESSNFNIAMSIRITPSELEFQSRNRESSNFNDNLLYR